MIRLRTRLTGVRQLQRSLDRVEDLLRSPLQRTYDEVAQSLVNVTRDAFERRFDPQRGARRWKRKVDGTPATLVRSGRMRRDLTNKRVWQLLGPKKLIFNPARVAFYWRFHQEGTKTLPRRGMLPSQRMVEKILTEALTKEAQRRWRG